MVLCDDFCIGWCCDRPSATGACAGCKQPLGYGRFLSCLGKNWHPDCFVCNKCSKPIADREVNIGSTIYNSKFR